MNRLESVGKSPPRLNFMKIAQQRAVIQAQPQAANYFLRGSVDGRRNLNGS
jgi:hypothetical protein